MMNYNYSSGIKLTFDYSSEQPKGLFKHIRLQENSILKYSINDKALPCRYFFQKKECHRER
jgi:hypothetical protein